MAGLSFGLLLALASVGLSLIFGTTGLTNFAHGEMVTLGAVLVFAFSAMNLPFWLAIILSLIGGGLFGYAQDAGLWRPLRRRGTGLVPMMIVSIGLALAVRYIIQFYFGGATQQLPFAQSAESRRSGLHLAQQPVVAGDQRSRDRADRDRAPEDPPGQGHPRGGGQPGAGRGLRHRRRLRHPIVWIVGGVLASLGGILWAYYRPGVTFMGSQILLLIFAGVTLGGLGTVFGALIGSVIVGIFVELTTVFGLAADLKYVGALFIMIVVLLFRPQGILGRMRGLGDSHGLRIHTFQRSRRNLQPDDGGLRACRPRPGGPLRLLRPAELRPGRLHGGGSLRLRHLHPELRRSLLVGLLIAVVCSVLFALILGIPTLRLRADYLAIVTIAAAEIVRYVVTTNQLTP